jgi:hypothetical protein
MKNVKLDTQHLFYIQKSTGYRMEVIKTECCKYKKKKKNNSNVIPVTGCRGPHFLDNRLTDGGEVISFYAPAALYPQEDSCYSFLLEAESIPGP